MQIILNGEATAVAEGISVNDLIAGLQLTGRRVAVEINGDLVPRSRWPEVRIKDGDRAEVVHAIGGG